MSRRETCAGANLCITTPTGGGGGRPGIKPRPLRWEVGDQLPELWRGPFIERTSSLYVFTHVVLPLLRPEGVRNTLSTQRRASPKRGNCLIATGVVNCFYENYRRSFFFPVSLFSENNVQTSTWYEYVFLCSIHRPTDLVSRYNTTSGCVYSTSISAAICSIHIS
jgi:hypothetical protein